MAIIHLTIYNDDGSPIDTPVENLPIELDSMTKMEATVGQFRQQALPQVSKLLLEEGQKTFLKKRAHP